MLTLLVDKNYLPPWTFINNYLHKILYFASLLALILNVTFLLHYVPTYLAYVPM